MITFDFIWFFKQKEISLNSESIYQYFVLYMDISNTLEKNMSKILIFDGQRNDQSVDMRAEKKNVSPYLIRELKSNLISELRPVHYDDCSHQASVTYRVSHHLWQLVLLHELCHRFTPFIFLFSKTKSAQLHNLYKIITWMLRHKEAVWRTHETNRTW